jgi:hypothetical protein
MFSGDFDRPKPLPAGQPTGQNNGQNGTVAPNEGRDRAVGAVVLLIGFVLLLMLVWTLDTDIFIPHNATRAVTLTWEAAHPTRPAVTLSAPDPGKQNAENITAP